MVAMEFLAQRCLLLCFSTISALVVAGKVNVVSDLDIVYECIGLDSSTLHAVMSDVN